MSRNKLKRLAIMVLLTACLVGRTPQCAFATGETSAPISEAETPAVSDSERVSQMFAALDTENPDKEAVREARAAYEALSTAQKMRVEGLERLLAAEALLPQEPETEVPTSPAETPPINTEAPDSSSQKSGTSYSFRINQYLRSLTLTMRYQTDENGDGRMDAPSVTLIAPNGTRMELGEETTLQDNNWDITVIYTQTFTQLDVAMAMDGTWKIETSNRVLFTLSDYAGAKVPESFAEVGSTEAAETQPGTQPDPQPARDPGKGLLILGIFVILVICLFVGMKKLPQITGKKKEAAKETKAKKEAEKKEREEKEMADFLAEWKKMQEEYSDQEEEPKQQKDNKGYEDERLTETVRDDEGLEIIPDQDPFAKSRF